MSQLKLFLLGPIRVEKDDQPLTFSRRRALALLTYLAMSRDAHTREALATLLWPDHDGSSSRAYLRRELAALNREIGEGWLLADRHQVGFDPSANLWVDVDDFRNSIAESQNNESDADAQALISQAITLYRGDFMAGFNLPDSTEFDEWHFFQLESLRRDFAGALERLTAISSKQGHYEEGINSARRWLSLDPLHEPVHRVLMELYAWAGQQAAALRQYDECVRILQDELGVPPDEQTVELHRAIKSRQITAPVVERVVSGGEYGESFIEKIADPHTSSEDKTIPQPDPSPAPQIAQVPTLPLPGTSFIGRESELVQILNLLTDEPKLHLLTIMGPGGMGKSRIAIEATRRLVDHFDHGVYFVPLSAVDSPEMIPAAVADALGIPLSPSAQAEEQIINFLRVRHCLIVLDNFEQLIDGVDLLLTLLDGAPDVKFVITSRQRLGIAEEWIFALDGLSIPEEEVDQPADSFDAVRLFADRARRILHTFSLATESEHVIRICQLLQGSPLGIELAATWTQLLTCMEIVEEFQKDLDFLTTSLPSIPKRQRSLRAAFDRSWAFLTEDQQRLFVELSVFRGGFTREAAVDITQARLPVLLALADRSLLSRGQDGLLQIHESLRQFGAEKLEEQSPIPERHAVYYIENLSTRTESVLYGEVETLQSISVDAANLQAAWQWTVAQLRGDLLSLSHHPMAYFYQYRGWLKNGVALFTEAHERFSTADVNSIDDQLLLAQLQMHLGWFMQLMGDTQEARSQLATSLISFRRLNASADMATNLLHLSYIDMLSGNIQQAKTFADESIEFFDEQQDQHGKALGLRRLGQIAQQAREYDLALKYLNEALAFLKGGKDLANTAKILMSIGHIHMGQGEYDEAAHLYAESYQMSRNAGDLAAEGRGLHSLALTKLRTGHLPEAQGMAAASLAIFLRLGERFGIASIRYVLGDIAFQQEEWQEAEAQLSQSLELHQLLENRHWLVSAHHLSGRVANAQGQLEAARKHFRNALQIAISLKLDWKIFECFPGVAVYLYQTQ